jgi:hypothetical protein
MQSLRGRFTDKDVISTFPVTAAPVVYCPPSVEDVAEKVADTGSGDAELGSCAPMVQRRGYDDLDDESAPAHFSTRQGGACMANARYELLREVWPERR